MSLLSRSSVSTDLKLMVLVFVKPVASVQSLFVALRVDSNINELSCKVASYSALSLSKSASIFLYLSGMKSTFQNAFFSVFIMEYCFEAHQDIQISSHLCALGLYSSCVRHWLRFSSSNYVAHLFPGVMGAISVIRRTPHEFKIVCLQVSVSPFMHHNEPWAQMND
jgi:hypothetical protein